MKILKYIILSIVASLGLWSCYDDKGNYDYHDLDEIVIDFFRWVDSGELFYLPLGDIGDTFKGVLRREISKWF